MILYVLGMIAGACLLKLYHLHQGNKMLNEIGEVLEDVKQQLMRVEKLRQSWEDLIKEAASKPKAKK